MYETICFKRKYSQPKLNSHDILIYPLVCHILKCHASVHKKLYNYCEKVNQFIVLHIHFFPNYVNFLLMAHEMTTLDCIK